jgi:hypothetical protein
MTRATGNEPHDVFVCELFQKTDLAYNRAWKAFVFHHELDLLKCDNLIRPTIASLIHDAVRPCPDR